MECPICQSEDNNSEYMKLPCKHIFHKQYIDKWTNKDNSCPIYRKPPYMCCEFIPSQGKN